jgi:hypothetical protein
MLSNGSEIAFNVIRANYLMKLLFSTNQAIVFLLNFQYFQKEQLTLVIALNTSSYEFAQSNSLV